ncbi:MAG: Asp-tRNA(Asn)/Glu-tRNA(Gln) amidotransferase subunit GatC [Schleiferiaceae bacterium]|jgi:aspartyl-tRNA(Asn)/glutamyl-tRNA(Gln) amidotransferase subunit C|nr:Asp-tRNA(Asn)/Glu-tRNA(Gln) amidotransferase subunit GatC [Schleiferiaceae bacterium]MDR9441222.1 Asp-tRNA(Asn)/Glu-tRNA(Gln) amidotransferase subunit GatC [Schleiferiaceae bacterium]
MKLTPAEVDKLAHLARLEFSAEEKKAMLDDMDKILQFVDKIGQLDLEGVAPLVYLNEEDHALRPDQVAQTVTKDEALKNAPQRDTDYFLVPKVMQRGQEEDPT